MKSAKIISENIKEFDRGKILFFFHFPTKSFKTKVLVNCTTRSTALRGRLTAPQRRPSNGSLEESDVVVGIFQQLLELAPVLASYDAQPGSVAARPWDVENGLR